MRRRSDRVGAWIAYSKPLARRTLVLGVITCFFVLTWPPLVLDRGARADGAPPREPRLALVVGNGSYQALPLATPVDDAGLIAQTLAQAGFDVTAAANADAATTRKLFDDFAAKLRTAGPSAVAFVYLAGYGVQIDGDNFFVPLDAKISRDTDVPLQAVSLAGFANVLQATPARARILVYDLARASPLPIAGLPLASGLNVTASPSATVTALNAAPGTVAEPDLAPYGVYAKALAETIRMPGLQTDALFQRIRLRVAARTNDGQVPYDAGRVDFVFYPSTAAPAETVPDAPIVGGMPIGDAFAICLSRDSVAAFNEFIRAFPTDPLTTRVRRMLAIRREVLIWSESLKADTPRAYWTYMRRYPRGPHFGDARRKLAQLNVALEPPPRFDIYDYFDLPPPSADELAIIAQRQHPGSDAASVPLPPAPLPPPRTARADNLPLSPTSSEGQVQQDRRPAPMVTAPAPSVPPPTGNTPSSLGKIPPMQPPAMPPPAMPRPPNRDVPAPKAATPAPTGAVPPSSQPSAAVSSSSPTGGATLGAIPPALRQQASAPAKPASAPGVSAPSAQAPQPTSPLPLEPSATATPSPPAAAGSTTPARIEPKPPVATPLPVTVPLDEKPVDAGPANRAAPPTKAPAPISVPPALSTDRLAPTDAPPSSRGPPDIGPEMLIPSRSLPSGFQPPAQPRVAAVTPAFAPSSAPASAASRPVVAQPPRPAMSDQPSVAPTPPPSTGIDARAPTETTLQHATLAGAGPPAEPPMPPPRPKMTPIRPPSRMVAGKRRVLASRRPNTPRR